MNVSTWAQHGLSVSQNKNYKPRICLSNHHLVDKKRYFTIPSDNNEKRNKDVVAKLQCNTNVISKQSFLKQQQIKNTSLKGERKLGPVDGHL